LENLMAPLQENQPQATILLRKLPHASDSLFQ
jgi:hypothetical protein